MPRTMIVCSLFVLVRAARPPAEIAATGTMTNSMNMPVPSRRLLARAGLFFALVLIAAACSGNDDADSGDTKETPTSSEVAPLEGSEGERRPPTGGLDRIVEPGENAGALIRAAAGPTAGVPVFEGDFADPFVLADGPIFYAYATNTIAANVPVYRSATAVRGDYLGDALPKLPEWTEPGSVWAPSVLPRDDGFVLYYTTRDVDSGRQCISLAVADQPQGPFIDESTGPLICQVDLGGSIDASPFVDTDGTAYLLWKSDGNCCNIETGIWAQQLGADGRGLVGEPVELLRADQPWEGELIEGPAMLEVDGKYFLFYSANAWDSADYAVGVAVCRGALGPCEKETAKPILLSQNGLAGPGGQEFFTDRQGRQWVVFHAWTTEEVGYPNGARSLFLNEIETVDGELRLVGLEEDKGDK